MKVRIFGVLLVPGLLFGLAACGGSPEENIHDHLEKSVEIEQDAAKDQNAIVKLEKKEKAIYEKMSGLGTDDFTEMNKLADQASANIKKRGELIDKEKESMDESEESFSGVKDQIEKLEKKKEKTQAEEMYKAMVKRYKLYSQLNKTYKHSLSEEQKMYKLFADKKAAQDQVKSQIEKVNLSYEKLVKDNEAFNKQTETYNKLKKAFYESTDLKVDYKDAKETKK